MEDGRESFKILMYKHMGKKPLGRARQSQGLARAKILVTITSCQKTKLNLSSSEFLVTC